MNETALGRFWELLGWVLAFNVDAFRQLETMPKGSIIVLIVVLSAGLSQAIAHSVILFANRVKPVRLFFSLLISAILFVFGYLFLVCSTWLISFAPFTVKATFSDLARTLGFSYAPLVFSAFGAMPYFGEPILAALSLWQLLAMVVGFAAISGASLWQSFGTVALGWVTLWVLQRTLGQPIVRLGYWIASKAAGVELITDTQKLKDFFQEFQLFSTAKPTSAKVVKLKRKPSSDRYSLRNIISVSIGLLALAVSTLTAAILLSPIRHWWFAWHNSLTNIFGLAFDLGWIAVTAVVTTALLSPLEALRWWAGWGDVSDVSADTKALSGVLSETQFLTSAQSAETHAAQTQRTAARYIVFLDGINQSEFEHTPDVEDFFDALESVLSEDVVLIKGIMSYSVRNRPLTINRPLSFVWRWINAFRINHPSSLFSYFVNIRNAWIVAVSADKRYGPIYNRGIAKVVCQTLLQRGYRPDSGLPITLIGFSGGGQMAIATASLLQGVLKAPIDVISLGGVMSGNINILELEHLYHLSGEKDAVERIGPVMFPKRWAIYSLSYWNRAKRLGKVSLISLGPVGHQVPGGIMDPDQKLPDGRTHLQQTVDLVTAILLEDSESQRKGHSIPEPKLSDYERYRAIAANRAESYPIHQSLPSEYYREIAPWMGRLILPAPERRQPHGVLFEVHHAPDRFQHLVSKIVTLQLDDEPETRSYVHAVNKDIHFSPQAEASVRDGNIHPTRLNHWRLVNPLESLAGAHPVDDVTVMLPRSVTVQQHGAEREGKSALSPILVIQREPVQITGRYYGLVQFIGPVANPPEPENDGFRVIHFNRATGQFDGLKETVKVPQTPVNYNDTKPSTRRGLENSPLNELGWYIYGAQDDSGLFVVQAIAPRKLLQAKPDRVLTGKKAAREYVKKKAWRHIEDNKGTARSALLKPAFSVQTQGTTWAEGQRALLIHVYGGIGGNKTEPAAKTPLYFGHFVYGTAEVVREPLTGELRFEIVYHQIYTQNSEGLTAGSLHWSRYMGDRAFGFLGLRPVADTLIKLDEFVSDYRGEGWQRSPLDCVMYELEIMAARYRIGDGTGATFVGPANNCAQDANQALYAALRYISESIRTHPNIEQWKQQQPDQARRLDRLEQFTEDFKQILLPWGTARADWEKSANVLGSTLGDHPVQNLIRGLVTWRTLLPRLASDKVTEAFLKRGGEVWILQTIQVGGVNPDIEPVAPMTL
ncbi:hypothetical protein C1752_08954 [Acaryochloris thomasi RCC1774]|uniref:CAAX protease n=1 Tax=Acaryochloris thomasi RCC1774 TaxID=1764569 RepID=A0A2W1JIA8_9CYAN|nr:CAAX protease [Acaryochloris thomasi]PZD70812.1 hypothetical protein C1752_08954 [Acaryochloris thomasi RCC1774]